MFEPPQRSTLEHVWTWKMPASAGGMTLRGVSRSAQATGFYIPELDWALDAGAKVSDSFPRQIFITHTHSDHACRIIHLKSRRVCPGLYLPQQGSALLTDYVRALQSLTDCRPFDLSRAQPTYVMHPVEPGQTHVIPHGQQRFEVDVVRCDHTIPCVGYAFYRAAKKLKPEYHGMPGHELGARRKRGEEIEQWSRSPLFAFLGDTTPRVYTQHPELLDFPVVIAECTFLEHPERAAKTGHTSWLELEAIVAANPKTLFVLIHHSLRHEPEDLLALVEAAGIENVVVWGA